MDAFEILKLHFSRACYTQLVITHGPFLLKVAWYVSTVSQTVKFMVEALLFTSVSQAPCTWADTWPGDEHTFIE